MAIITISRGTFSGGQILAECVGRHLGYRCLSGEFLLEAASEYGVSKEKLSQAISEAPRLLERLHSERGRCLACLRAALIREAKDGNVVYHGHAGHFLLEGVPQVLRVRVIANMEFRVAALTERGNLSRPEALQFIERLDEGRTRWTRLLYHVDWRDPSLYDVVVNLDQMSLHDACEVVCHIANLERYKTTPEWRKLMDDMLLSSNLEALIANAGNISGGEEVKIGADAGVVTVEGTVGSLVDADRVRLLVMKMPGVTQIDSRMRVRLFGVTTQAIK